MDSKQHYQWMRRARYFELNLLFLQTQAAGITARMEVPKKRLVAELDKLCDDGEFDPKKGDRS